MRRPLRIAYAGASDRVRATLAGLLAGFGVRERIEAIGMGAPALKAHAYEHFDLVFIEQALPAGAAQELAKALRAVSDETLLALVVDQIDAAAAAAAVNEARVDAIVPRDASGSAMKNALTRTLDLCEERRRLFEMRLGRDALDAAGTPGAVLDREYRLLFATPSAGALFAEGDPFRMTSAGQVVCATPSATKRFHDALRGSGGLRRYDCGSVFIRADREAGRKPVIVVSLPRLDGDDHRHGFHIILKDLERQHTALAGDFAAALDLSAAEGRLVQALAGGLNLEQASGEINISINTARSYLKAIFEKTGARRQADLVRLALLAVA